MEFEVIELSSGPIKTPDSITTQSITEIIKLLGNSLDPPCYQMWKPQEYSPLH